MGWLELHHPSSSSHITSNWKVIATVTEAKHSIHSKPQTWTAISGGFFQTVWQTLLLKLEPFEDNEWSICCDGNFPATLLPLENTALQNKSKHSLVATTCQSLYHLLKSGSSWRSNFTIVFPAGLVSLCVTKIYLSSCRQAHKDPTQSCRGIDKLFVILKWRGL